MVDKNIFSEKNIDPYPVLEINSSALDSNVRLLKKITGSRVKLLVPVKANAYGCGFGEIIKYFNANPPDYLGVANPFEGIEARENGWKGNILNLGGFFPETAEIFFKYNIMPAITDFWQIELLNTRAQQTNSILNVHLKLDLGMGRIGLMVQDMDDCIDSLHFAKNIHIAGIFTHFPSSDQPDFISNNLVLKKFYEQSGIIMDKLHLPRHEVILHAANSYAVMLNPDSRLDMIRPGLCFYGYFANNADREKLSREFPFKPSLKLKVFPVSIRNYPKGSTISYGETYTVVDDLIAGVIPLGYADGIPRALSNKISFGKYPLLGRVTMDQTVIGGLTTLNEELELLGDHSPPLELWADLNATTSYEIMVRLGERIQRKLV
ncbi:MAG: alanine racemase [Spirochaetia bacterium]|nr:alanine racemase [Spirochaetia bacterium]